MVEHYADHYDLLALPISCRSVVFEQAATEFDRLTHPYGLPERPPDPLP
jgi:hypothetical protein